MSELIKSKKLQTLDEDYLAGNSDGWATATLTLGLNTEEDKLFIIIRLLSLIIATKWQLLFKPQCGIFFYRLNVSE